jgi:hypothetical protein
MLYELQRRTKYSLQKKDLEIIVKYSYGNLRHALIKAFAKMYCNIHDCSDQIIDQLLQLRPKECSDDTWIEWAIQTENKCKLESIDLRDVLRIGWPNSTTVANTCAQWSRLGGTSPRTLFFDCISVLCGKKL